MNRLELASHFLGTHKPPARRAARQSSCQHYLHRYELCSQQMLLSCRSELTHLLAKWPDSFSWKQQSELQVRPFRWVCDPPALSLCPELCGYTGTAAAVSS